MHSQSTYPINPDNFHPPTNHPSSHIISLLNLSVLKALDQNYEPISVSRDAITTISFHIYSKIAGVIVETKEHTSSQGRTQANILELIYILFCRQPSRNRIKLQGFMKYLNSLRPQKSLKNNKHGIVHNYDIQKFIREKFQNNFLESSIGIKFEYRNISKDVPISYQAPFIQNLSPLYTKRSICEILKTPSAFCYMNQREFIKTQKTSLEIARRTAINERQMQLALFQLKHFTKAKKKIENHPEFFQNKSENLQLISTTTKTMRKSINKAGKKKPQRFNLSQFL